MARSKKKVKIKKVLFIACEGTSSEYGYFKSWAEKDEVLEIFERVDVYPGPDDEKPKTTPYQLVQIATQQLQDGSADYAWVVFDKDVHPKMKETFELATSSDVKIAFSSRSFEEWILMHFEKKDEAFNVTECKNSSGHSINCGTSTVPTCIGDTCLAAYIRLKGFLPEYSKSKTFDLYAAIHNRTKLAFINSAWLRSRVNASLNYQHKIIIYNLNPYTDVDQLISIMLDKTCNIEWGPSDTDISLNNWIINAKKRENKIILQISNSKNAIALNSHFQSDTFFTTNDNLDIKNCSIDSYQFLKNQNESKENLLVPGDVVEYIIQTNDQPYFLFQDASTSTQIYVIL